MSDQSLCDQPFWHYVPTMNLLLLYPFHQARLTSIITFLHFSVYRWGLCGLSQSTNAHHVTRFYHHSPTQALSCLFLGFLPGVFLFYYTSVTLFSSLFQIPRCPFNTCLSRCSIFPVFIVCICCTHTIPVVVSLFFTPHPFTHTHRHWQVVPCLFISTSRWLDLL